MPGPNKNPTLTALEKAKLKKIYMEEQTKHVLDSENYGKTLAQRREQKINPNKKGNWRKTMPLQPEHRDTYLRDGRAESRTGRYGETNGHPATKLLRPPLTEGEGRWPRKRPRLRQRLQLLERHRDRTPTHTLM